MRMHRGSSKDVRARPRTTESLPLSASPPSLILIDVEVARGGRSSHHRLEVLTGTLVRTALKQLGEAPEGSAVLVDDTPIPLDTPLEAPTRLLVVPTFSGG
jgi:sulfur carrier protein ThiS